MTELTPSNLEVTHDFRDPVFRSYMNILKPGSYYAPPGRLIEMASGMSGHHHPLVRYAAGWAATEAGTVSHWSGVRNRWTLGNREEALDIGNTIWYGINDNEWKHFAPASDHGRQAQLWSLNMRRRIAMAYLPALHLAARSRAGEPITAQGIYEGFKIVKRGLLPTVSVLLDDPNDNSEQSSAMRGLASEIAAAWLLQSGFLQLVFPTKNTLQPECIVTPASLRDDHHRRPADRCDLNTYSLDPLESPGKRTSVQVEPQQQGQTKSFGITQRDLCGKPGTQQEFLLLIQRYEMGYNKNTARLLEVSNNLRRGLRLYKQQHP